MPRTYHLTLPLLFAGHFNTVLAMHARSNASDAPDRAERVVSQFRVLAGMGALMIKPDRYTYSLLLKTWYVLMQGNHPDCATIIASFYSTLVTITQIHRTTSQRPDGMAQAIFCFDWMRFLSASGDAAACPDAVKVCE
jgi:hypothetical protein